MVNLLKYGVTSAVALLLIAGRAVAAEPSLPALHHQWSGFYGGINFGIGWGDADYLNIRNNTLYGDALPGNSFSHGMSGLIGGVQAGWNWQRGWLVAGVEVSLDGGAMSGRRDTAFGIIDDRFRTEVEALVLATGRLGVVFDDWLVYMKGGYAGGRVIVSVIDTIGPNVGSANSSAWQHGFDLGLGTEFRLSRNWSAGVEYNYIDLGSARHELAGSEPGTYAWDVSLPAIHSVTVRVNYYFN